MRSASSLRVNKLRVNLNRIATGRERRPENKKCTVQTHRDPRKPLCRLDLRGSNREDYEPKNPAKTPLLRSSCTLAC